MEEANSIGRMDKSMKGISQMTRCMGMALSIDHALALLKGVGAKECT
jgi:hypothetical protein